MSPRRGFALIALASILGACGSLIGIQDLGVDTSTAAPLPDARTRVEPDATNDAPAPSIDAGGDAGVVDATMASKRVFLTSLVMMGNLGNHPGVGGADSLCNAAANAQLLGGGPWVAWMSGNGMNAIDRLDGTYDGPYVTLTGRQIVANKAQLASGDLDGPIDVTEDKQPASSAQPWVWTGTVVGGDTSATCKDWTTNDPNPFVTVGTIGAFDQSTAGKWTDDKAAAPYNGSWACNTNARLYCFEK